MTFLEQIGEWLAADRKQQNSPAVSERLGIHLLDTIGAWIAGRFTEEGAMLARLKTSSRTSPSLLGDHPLDRIALACATIRLTEIDDIHMASCTTPSSVVVPVALYLAAAQSPPVDSRIFTSALLTGYEVMTRFGAAIDGAHLVYKGIWPTYFCAPMAAAAVAARIFNLDAAKTANALGIAFATTSGAPGGPSSPSPRWLLLGLAARAGCSAALAAAEGYAADRTLLDGNWLQRTHGIAIDTASLSAAPERTGTLNGFSLKPYCAAKQCIAAIEASRELFAQGISPDDISALQISVPPAYASMIGHHQARNGRVPRITSAAYNIALAAYEPDELPNVSRPDRTANPHISNFMGKIEVIADEELSRHYPERWPARAEATLRDGKNISSFILDSPGDPSHPFDSAKVQAKFHRYADAQMGEKAATELAATCLEASENAAAIDELCAWAMKF
ncbi:MAG TPA: MmgE/PrpD family protein [Candidatus Acidoferrales bacterium]